MDEASAQFATLTGVTPAPGGRHVGLGTANALVGLGGAGYLEIVGPDPYGPPPEGRRPFAVDDLREPRLVTWAVRSTDLGVDVAAARRGGYDPGRAREMSRRTPTGELLRWQLTLAPDGVDTGPVPFLIDWLDTPHPTTAGLPAVELTAFEVHGPAVVASQLAALGLGVTVIAAPVGGLLARLTTPRGPVVLR